MIKIFASLFVPKPLLILNQVPQLCQLRFFSAKDMNNIILRQSHKSGTSFCHSVTYGGITSVYSISNPDDMVTSMADGTRRRTNDQCSNLMAIVDGILEEMRCTKEDVLTMNFRLVALQGGGRRDGFESVFASSKRDKVCQIMLKNWISKHHRPVISVTHVPSIAFKPGTKIELDMTFRNLSNK